MSYCINCGREIPQGEVHCYACAQGTQYCAPVQTDQREDGQKALDALSLRLKHQSLAWKIGGFISIAYLVFFLIFGGIYIAFGGLVMNVSTSNSDEVTPYYYDYNDDYYDYYDDYHYDYYDDYDYGSQSAEDDFLSVFFMFYGIAFIALGIITYVPTMIINFIMTKKVASYRENIYTDCTNAVKHSGNVGNIVLGAFFNPGALVFAIINLVHYNSKKELFARVISEQQAYNQRYQNR